MSEPVTKISSFGKYVHGEKKKSKKKVYINLNHNNKDFLGKLVFDLFAKKSVSLNPS